MKIMTGIDLHSNNALCGLMDESGRRVLHKKLPCELPAILQMLEPYKAQIAQVAVESTYNWYWLVDGLEDQATPSCWPTRRACTNTMASNTPTMCPTPISCAN